MRVLPALENLCTELWRTLYMNKSPFLYCDADWLSFRRGWVISPSYTVSKDRLPFGCHPLPSVALCL